MLTAEQLAILKTNIESSTDQEIIDALAIRNDNAIAEYYNRESTFVVWRSRVSVEEYRDALVWTEVDQLTTGAARIWDWITAHMQLPIESGKPEIRQGIADAWGSNTTTRANLLAVAKRLATKAEALFSTGTGTDANPGGLVFEGTLTSNDIARALN